MSRRIVFENGNISVGADGIEHYPPFAAAFVNEMEPESEGPAFRPSGSVWMQ